MDKAEMERIQHEFRYGKPSGVEFNCSIRLELSEIAHWEPEQVQALITGIVIVVNAGQGNGVKP